MDDRVVDEVLGAPGLSDPARERRWLGTLLDAARRAAGRETKVARLRRFLASVREPAIVFTEYRDTLCRLQRALTRHDRPVLTLHGGMSASERRDVQQAFNDRDCLLLATDAAAEGLNLQQRCRLVVHFELPWNPLRLEQRTGRVDRIGQTRRVHEVALIADETAERIVLAPLARRAAGARPFAASGGRMLELLTEAHVAEAVMEGTPQSLQPCRWRSIASADPRLASEAAAEAARLRTVREWLASERAALSDAPPALTMLHTRAADETVLILSYTLSLVTADGLLLHAEPLVLRVALASPPPRARTAAGMREALQQALGATQPRIDALISARFAALDRDVVPGYRAILVAMEERDVAIAGGRQSAARQMVQAGLFDRRALREAERQAAARDRRAREAADHAIALEAAAAPTRSVRLDAALIRTDVHA